MEIHSDFDVAFGPPSVRLDSEGRRMTTRVRPAGHLALPSGALAVGDALTGLARLEGPNGPLPTGPCAVEVAVVDLEDPVDERSTAARVRFFDRPAVRWEPAEFGAGVDSGTCGFADGGDAERWMREEADGDALIAALEASETRGTCSIASGRFGGVAGVAFSSGWGDGLYDGFWGFDAEGDVVEFVYDFRILVTPVFTWIPVPTPLQPGPVELDALRAIGGTATLYVPGALERMKALFGVGSPPTRLRLGWTTNAVYARWRQPDGATVIPPPLDRGASSYEIALTEGSGELVVGWVTHELSAPHLAATP